MTLKLKNFAMKNQELLRELSKKIKEIEKQLQKIFFPHYFLKFLQNTNAERRGEYLADVERHILATSTSSNVRTPSFFAFYPPFYASAAGRVEV
jgi:hypothetical protein